jgi:hypothetical protein
MLEKDIKLILSAEEENINYDYYKDLISIAKLKAEEFPMLEKDLFVMYLKELIKEKEKKGMV